jgi:glycosyltransferase involved in cell wall biosynthesis
MRKSNIKSKNIILSIWADPRGYLALQFTSATLKQKGYTVHLVYRNSSTDEGYSGELLTGEESNAHPIGNNKRGWGDYLNYLLFVLKLVQLTIKHRPVAVFGYNRLGLLAAFVSTIVVPKTPLVYHNFDFDLAQFGSIKGAAEKYAARFSDLVVLPSKGREDSYRELASLTKASTSVCNCYPAHWKHPASGELEEILSKRELHFEHLVIRLGMVGPNHGLEQIISSIGRWPRNVGLILAGFGTKEYFETLENLAEKLKLDQQVVFLPFVSQSLWNDILACGDVGLALYEPFNISHDHMAGTSQKFNGYLAAGIPSIVPDTPDFLEFLKDYECSIAVDVKTPSSIAEAVNSLIMDKARYARLASNAKRAHLKEFNFETQFDFTLRWLDAI